jgi:DNA-binding response OmpR family regulator
MSHDATSGDTMSQDTKLPDKILVIEDDETNADLLATKLGALGYDVTIALTAEEGIEADARIRPQLILLDVMLPEMTGFEVCRRLIEKHKDTRFVPIILVTGMKDVDAKIKGLDSGAHDYVTKPYDAQELMARVQSALRTKALYDELKATREKLTEAEKLVALGQMSITLHHEINNPLQAIMLLAESMMDDTPPDDASRESFDEIMKSCLRIQEVLKKVKNIKRIRSAPYVGETEMLDLEKSS